MLKRRKAFELLNRPVRDGYAQLGKTLRSGRGRSKTGRCAGSLSFA